MTFFHPEGTMSFPESLVSLILEGLMAHTAGSCAGSKTLFVHLVKLPNLPIQFPPLLRCAHSDLIAVSIDG